MRALKTLVIVMGVLILAGMGLVGYTLIKRGMNTPASPSLGAQAPSAAEHPYGPVEIELPQGAHVASTHTAGGRLVIELALAGGAERVLVVDLSSGAILGTIDLKPTP
jgi:hypothetical protein